MDKGVDLPPVQSPNAARWKMEERDKRKQRAPTCKDEDGDGDSLPLHSRSRTKAEERDWAAKHLVNMTSIELIPSLCRCMPLSPELQCRLAVSSCFVTLAHTSRTKHSPLRAFPTRLILLFALLCALGTVPCFKTDKLFNLFLIRRGRQPSARV